MAASQAPSEDCYLCGHPILEGQRANATGDGPKLIQWEHANPADHLPTLDKLPVQTLSERAMRRVSAPYVRDARREERERAAKIVIEFIAENPYMENIQEELAKRIRSGDE